MDFSPILWNTYCTFRCLLCAPLEFSLNGAKFSLNSVNSGNSENLRNHWGMNWVQNKDLLYCLWLCGWVVESLSLKQEILGSNQSSFLILIFLSLNSANSVKAFRENSIILYFHTRTNIFKSSLSVYSKVPWRSSESSYHVKWFSSNSFPLKIPDKVWSYVFGKNNKTNSVIRAKQNYFIITCQWSFLGNLQKILLDSDLMVGDLLSGLA